MPNRDINAHEGGLSGKQAIVLRSKEGKPHKKTAPIHL